MGEDERTRLADQTTTHKLQVTINQYEDKHDDDDSGGIANYIDTAIKLF